MHTIKIVIAGLALLALCLFFGRLVGGVRAMSTAALVFLPLWLIGAGVNMYIGVKSAGYSFSEELPVFLLVFSAPALAALALWWRLR
jgi:hypothetical protein